MYIFADESGHSGKHIFNNPETYYQGAILSVEDIEPPIKEVIDKVCKELNIERLHANEIKPNITFSIISDCTNLLKEFNWEFYSSQIHKPYISVTKFVDAVFDPAENKGFPARWYWQNLQRHSLCCLFDDVLTNSNKVDFWWAYLNNDYDKFNSVLIDARYNIEKNCDKGSEICFVAIGAIEYALNNIYKISLSYGRSKKSYKKDTPNMIAFSNLLQGIHNFCDKHNVSPIKFIHDQQSEFGGSMRNWCSLFESVQFEEKFTGKTALLKKSKHNLKNFQLKSSKDSYGLQLVDLFIWVSQREKESDEINKAKDSIIISDNSSQISRGTSETVKFAHRARECKGEGELEKLLKLYKLI